MNTFRVAVIGCGRIGTQHVKAYQADPRARIVGLCDSDPDKARALNKTCGLEAQIYTDYQEMVRKEKPDQISVALWTHLHLPVVRDLFALQIRSVHCEKPVAPTWGEVQEMARLAGNGPTRLTFNHQRRFSWAHRTARNLLFGGEFGGLLRIEVFNPENILDWGTHMMDLIHMYNREVPVKWVMGQLDARQPKQWFSIPYEFAFLGALKFANGVRVVIHSGDDKEMGCGMRLHCSNGLIEFRDENLLRSMKFGEGKWLEQTAPADPFATGFAGTIKHLLDTLESGEPAELRWEHAVKAAEVIYGLYESARRRARVELPFSGFTDHPFVTMLQEGVIGPATPPAPAPAVPAPAKPALIPAVNRKAAPRTAGRKKAPRR